MKYLLASALVLSFLGLSYVSIHAFDTYAFKCEVPSDAAPDRVISAEAVTASVPSSIDSSSVRGGLASVQRRSLGVPDWAIGE